MAVRTAAGTQILSPGRSDTSFAGYDKPILSNDHTFAAWLEEQGAPVSDASYPEPTVAWLFTGGQPSKPMGCDGGEPFDLRFGGNGRTLILVCSFPHGEPHRHELSFDTASGRCLSSRDMQSGRRLPCAGSPSQGRGR